MDTIQIVVLALIQGLTEFLPVSSSAHLILPKELLGWPDQGLAFDVAVHVGTLTAVVIYFRQDVGQIIVGWLNSVIGKGLDEHGKLAWFVAVATVPAGLVGLILGDAIETHLRSIMVIAVTTIVFGIFLGVADRTKQGTKTLAQLTLVSVLIIGCAQAMALVPGTSRSGITITAALFLGFVRSDAAKFSFLMSIPIIVLSGGLKGLSLLEEANVDWYAIGLGTLISGVSAYICIHYFLSFINKLSMMPFVYYRLLLGLVLVGMILAK